MDDDVVDAEYEVIRAPRGTPWWRRIYLRKGWWWIAALAIAAGTSQMHRDWQSKTSAPRAPIAGVPVEHLVPPSQ